MLPVPGAAQEGPLTLRAGSTDTVEVVPGGRSTVAFHLTHRGSDSVRLREDLALPDGWRLVAPPRVRGMAPDAERVALAVFRAPARARPGHYRLRYRVLTASDPSRNLGSASRVLRVRPRPALEARLQDSPRQIVAGRGYRVRIRITNTGNVALRARLELRSHGRAARATRDVVRLDPGKREVVEVVVDARTGRGNPGEHVLQAYVTAQEDSTVRDVATSRVPVVSRPGSASPQGAPEFRSRITTRSTRTPGEVAPFEIRGGGPVPLGDGSRLTYLLRGPDTDWGAFGYADEYWVSLRTRGLDLDLGDRLYRLSTLTEPGRYAFGGSFEARAGDVRLGGFYNAPRRGEDFNPEWAAFAGVQPSDGFSLRLNYLQRPDGSGRTAPAHPGGSGPAIPARGEGPAHLASTEARLRLGPAAALSAEVGRSVSPAGAADAYSADLSGQLLGLSYRVARTVGEPGHASSADGLRQDVARVATDVGSVLHLEGFFQDHEVRGETGPEAADGPSHRAYRQLGGRLGVAGLVSLEADRTLRVRDDGPRSHRIRSDAAGARSTWAMGDARVQARGEVGRHVDLRAAREDAYRRLGVQVDVGSGRTGHLGVGIEGFSGHRLFRDRPEMSVRTRVEASVPLGSDLEIGASGEARWFLDRDEVGHGLARGRLSYRLPFGHRVSVRSRVPLGGSLGTGGTRVLAEYSASFGVSLSNEGSTTPVEGRVYDATSREGIGGVTVRVADRTAVTDERGRFSVEGLAAGHHHLRLVSASLDPALTTTRPMPRVVKVDGGAPAGVEIAVARAGDVTGSVGLLRGRPRSRPGREGADERYEHLEDAVVVLSGEAGTFTETTDAAGRFSFRHVPPGPWKLSVSAHDLPRHHAFDRTELDVRLEPGGEVEVEFRARPDEREIRVIERGDVGEAEPSPDGEDGP